MEILQVILTMMVVVPSLMTLFPYLQLLKLRGSELV